MAVTSERDSGKQDDDGKQHLQDTDSVGCERVLQALAQYDADIESAVNDDDVSEGDGKEQHESQVRTGRPNWGKFFSSWPPLKAWTTKRMQAGVMLMEVPHWRRRRRRRASGVTAMLVFVAMAAKKPPVAAKLRKN